MRDKAKTFMFVCIGILALVIAYQLAVQESFAEVGPVGDIYGLEGNCVLLVNGEVWAFSDGNWIRATQFDPPIAASEIAMWALDSLVSTSGEIWMQVSDNLWVNAGMPPGGSPAMGANWSQVKDAYREGK